MKPLFTLVFVASLWTAVPAAPAANWPTHQHDNARSGVTTEALDAPSLSLAWLHRAPHPPRPAWHGRARRDAWNFVTDNKSQRAYDRAFNLIAVGDQVYYASSAENAVVCLNAADGTEAWRRSCAGAVRIAPTFYGGRIYAGSDDGTVYCFASDTGTTVWTYQPVPGAAMLPNDHQFISEYPCRTGVLVQDGMAYAGFGLMPWETNFLVCLNAATGAEVYKTALNTGADKEHTLEGPLLATSDRLFALQGRISPVVFNLATGSRLDRLRGGGGSFALITPDQHIVHGPGFGSNPKVSNRINHLQENSATSLGSIASHPRAHALLAWGTVRFLLVDDSVQRVGSWSRGLDTPRAMILGGSTLYVGARNRVLALDATTGDTLNAFDVDGTVYSFALANGRLVASTSSGRIYAFQ